MANKRKTFWIVLIGAVVVALFIILIVLQKKKDERPFNQFDFPETVEVTNGTEFNKVDTIALVLAHKVFEFDTLDLKIYYIPNVVEGAELDEIEFKGFAQKLPFGEHKYLILLSKKLSFSELKSVLSHEFIHISQYESKRLEVFGKTYVWEGDTAYFDGYDVNRSFEMEAFNGQNEIKKKLDKILYE